MGPSAKVTSIAAVADFREAWMIFLALAREALTTMDSEVRTARHLLEESLKEWERLAKQREEQWVEAKLILHRQKLSRVFGRPIDTTVEEEAVRKAQRRLQEVQDKIVKTRKWLPRIERAVLDYQGPKQQLAVMIETDAVKATAFLDQKLMSLEEYVKLHPVEQRAPLAGPQAEESTP